MIYIVVAVLVILVVVCAFGWFSRYLSTAVLLWYLQEKNFPFPTDAEMKTGSKFVSKRIVEDVFKKKG